MSASTGDNNSKPLVAVLGGCGFIGRNLVEYLINNNLVGALRVVDKTPPQLAWLNSEHAQVFEDPRVEYKSANLINPTSCAAALDLEDGTWSLVVNCAGETRAGQTEAVYAEGIVTLSSNVAQQCAKHNVQRLIEISSGHIYSSDKDSHKEDGPIDPWTIEGRMKYKVEQELKNLQPELNYTILRPALVYGVGDRRSLAPRLLLGGIYKHLNETMKLLWTGDLKLNTVHVQDLCRAIWLVGTESGANHQIYNVTDDGKTTQGILAEIVAEIFKINHDYYGTAMSTLAKNDITSVAEEANDKHLCAWADICRKYELGHTPLDPTIGQELLLNKHLNLDGGKLKDLSFSCDVPRPTVDRMREILEDYAAMNLFPKELLL